MQHILLSFELSVEIQIDSTNGRPNSLDEP